MQGISLKGRISCSLVINRLFDRAKGRTCHCCMLLMWFPCSITVDDIGDGMSDDLQAEIVTIILKRMSIYM